MPRLDFAAASGTGGGFELYVRPLASGIGNAEGGLLELRIAPTFAATLGTGSVEKLLTDWALPLNVSFTDQSTGSPASWRWAFGDGNTSTDKNPVYTYSKSGNYTVSLTINNSGNISTETRSRYIAVSK